MKFHKLFVVAGIISIPHFSLNGSCPALTRSGCDAECVQEMRDIEMRLQSMRMKMEQDCPEKSAPWARCCTPSICENEDYVIVRMPVPSCVTTECVDAACIEREGMQPCLRVRVVCAECSVDMMIDEQSVCVGACPEKRDNHAPCTRTYRLPCNVCMQSEKVKVEHNPMDNTIEVTMPKKSCTVKRIPVNCCPR